MSDTHIANDTNEFETNSNESTRTQLGRRLAKNPGVILEQLAASHDCSLAEVIESLPRAMWQRRSGSDFVALLQAMHHWQSAVTVIVHSADAILEFTGPLPAGEVSHGFYNWHGSTGLHGHLRYQNCDGIYLIERPFMGKPTVSVIFCNQAGEVMFKIFVGRDDDGQLRGDQISALRDFFAAGDQ